MHVVAYNNQYWLVFDANCLLPIENWKFLHRVSQQPEFLSGKLGSIIIDADNVQWWETPEWNLLYKPDVVVVSQVPENVAAAFLSSQAVQQAAAMLLQTYQEAIMASQAKDDVQTQ